MRKMLPYSTRKGKDDEIKLFHGRRGRHLCGKRLEVFVCVRRVSAEASAQEMTALHHSIKKSTKRKVVVSIAIKEYSMSRDSTRQLSPNFKVREFACKGSDVVLLDDELVVLLQCIREHFGKPVHITSGYRTAAHNAAVGGSKSSQHLLGRAADFHVEGCRRRLRRDPAALPGRHWTVSEGRRPPEAQHRLGAYRYPGGQEPVEDVKRL